MRLEIKILGTGCPKCNALEKAVREVVEENGLDARVIKVSDVGEIARHGVMLTPGLVVDGKVKSVGKVPSKADIKKYLEN